MKRLLMIAYDFPPLLAGVRRTVGFARHLPEFGWQPDVLTVKPVRSWAYDPQPLADLERRGVRVFRAGSRDPYRLAHVLGRWPRGRGGAEGGARAAGAGGRGAKVLDWLRRHWLCPDDRVGWVGPAFRLAMELVEREKPHAIWSTSYPNSAHLVGLRLKQRYPNLPWVADFRDGWTQNEDFFAPLSPPLQAKSAALERQVAMSADAIVAVSEPITRHFRALAAKGRGNREIERRVITIPNGFDPQDLAAAPRKEWEGFALVYAGLLFGARTAEPIFAMASQAARLDSDLGRQLRLVFVGAFGGRLRATAHRFGLADRLVEAGPLPHLEALGAQRGASVLVALVPPTPNAALMTTQKIFEYLALGPPVLALAPAGSCRNLVERVGGGVVCDPGDPVAAAKALIEIRRKWLAGEWRRASPEALAPYERRNLTGELARLLAVL